MRINPAVPTRHTTTNVTYVCVWERYAQIWKQYTAVYYNNMDKMEMQSPGYFNSNTLVLYEIFII